MKRIQIIVVLVLLFIHASANAQSVFAIKKWSGRYPSMQNDYPLTFVSFRGWLPPIPYTFIRIYPSHYYYRVDSAPIYAPKTYVDLSIQGLQRLLLETWNKVSLQQSMEHINSTLALSEEIEGIADKIWASKKQTAPDFFNVSTSLNAMADRIYKQRELELNSAVIIAYENQYDSALHQYQLIRQMNGEPGQKMEALKELHAEVMQSNGEMDYLNHKIRSAQSVKSAYVGLSFLGE